VVRASRAYALEVAIAKLIDDIEKRTCKTRFVMQLQLIIELEPNDFLGTQLFD
jgi:hypothetical protein